MTKNNVSQSIGQRIKECRLKLNLSAEDIAKKLGKDRATIYLWEGGYIERMPLNILTPLAQILKTTPEYIMGWDTESNISLAPIDRDVVRIPVYGVIPAGVPIEAIQDILDYEEIPRKLAQSGDYFGLKVQGSSMYPKIENGDIVIIKQQSVFNNGDICAVMVNGFDATLKRVKKEKDGIELIPINPEYETKKYSVEQCQTLPIKILGKVVEIRRKL